jgi:hypothetical protein
MAGKEDIFLDDMAFDRELDELEKKGPTAVALFTAREVHQMCKTCRQHGHDIEQHTKDIEDLKKIFPNKKDSIISGAGGGAASGIVTIVVYYIGKWLHFWS